AEERRAPTRKQWEQMLAEEASPAKKEEKKVASPRFAQAKPSDEAKVPASDAQAQGATPKVIIRRK
ncbi:MAG: hypothetical protein EBU86_02065, partial [Actinobacteria bacterium]|nr:hypothetical protein [Actinomycetota bacterium]